MTSYWIGQLRPGKNIRRSMIGNQGVCRKNKWENRQCCRDTGRWLLWFWNSTSTDKPALPSEPQRRVGRYRKEQQKHLKHLSSTNCKYIILNPLIFKHKNRFAIIMENICISKIKWNYWTCCLRLVVTFSFMLHKYFGNHVSWGHMNESG